MEGDAAEAEAEDGVPAGDDDAVGDEEDTSVVLSPGHAFRLRPAFLRFTLCPSFQLQSPDPMSGEATLDAVGGPPGRPGGSSLKVWPPTRSRTTTLRWPWS